MSEQHFLTVQQCQPHFDIPISDQSALDFSIDIHLKPLLTLIEAAGVWSPPYHHIYASLSAGIDWQRCYQRIAIQLGFDADNTLVLDAFNSHALFGYFDKQGQNWIQGQIRQMPEQCLLVVRSRQLIKEPETWQRFKTLLETRSLDLKNIDKRATGHLELNKRIKLLVIGSQYDWQRLNEQDEDMADFFPFLLPLINSSKVSTKFAEEFNRYIRALLREQSLLPLSDNAWSLLYAYSSRLAEDNQRLATDTVALGHALASASQQASKAELTHIGTTELKTAMQMRRFAQRQYFEDVKEMYANGSIKVEFSGEVIGQINGLTVVETAGIEYGEPSRITASVFYGDGDIIDIERKAELGGNIHAKGVMLLSAYIAQRFAKNTPMHLSASLVFEQSYHEVDGDSATLAELCCLMSALAEVPVDQSIAVTGAVDQFGAVQAVGGVNEKIEGFYRIASSMHADEVFTVILPQSNVCQLNLADDVLEAIESGKLRLLPITQVEQALRVLIKGKATELSHFDGDVVKYLYYKIEARLAQLEHQFEEQGLFGKIKHALFRKGE